MLFDPSKPLRTTLMDKQTLGEGGLDPTLTKDKPVPVQFSSDIPDKNF